MDKIKDYLLKNQDVKYRAFTLPLLPNIDEESFIGVRLPIIKKYAKELDDQKKKHFYPLFLINIMKKTACTLPS